MHASERASKRQSGPAGHARAGSRAAPAAGSRASLPGTAFDPQAAGPLTASELLDLQSTAGNAAVTRLVAQRDPITSDPVAADPAPGADAGTDAATTPAAPAETRHELHPGDGPGVDVGELQQKLNATEAATPPLRITAMYTEATTAAVLSFQANHALPATGIADIPTWSSLDTLAPSVVRNGRIVVDAPGGANPLGPPEGATHPTIRAGSRGPAVEELQQRLNNAPTGDVPTLLETDGKFGPLTRKAVVEFQTAHPPLATDGVVGPATWAKVDLVPGAVSVGRVEFSSSERVEGNTYGGDTRYTWRLTDDALEVTVNINFTGLSSHPQVAVWLGQIRTVWNTFKFVDDTTPGKSLTLRFVANQQQPGDNDVRVYSAAPGTPQFRSDSGDWNVQDPDGGLAPHEFGHLIGLQDEYRLGADVYRRETGEEALIGEVTGDAPPQDIADALWTAVNSSPKPDRAKKARDVVSGHSLRQGGFSQRVAEAYEQTHSGDMLREDFVANVGYKVVPNPGGSIDLDIAARLPGQADEARVTNPFTYTNRSLMGNMQSLNAPQDAGGVTSAHDHPVEERHVRHLLALVQANRPGSWRLVRD